MNEVCSVTNEGEIDEGGLDIVAMDGYGRHKP